MKTTSNGRQPQNMKSEISLNHLSDHLQILNLYWGDQTKIKNFFKWRQPPMEDNLKIFKVEYLSNQWSDLPQIWNLCVGDQTKIKSFLKWRQPPMDDDHKKIQVEYLSNHWSDLP